MSDAGRVICGFAGVGKSTVARERAGVVDLESTPFQRDWKTYARVAGHMAANGYTVLVSCHKELRQELMVQDIAYVVVMPPADDATRMKYMQRYRDRGDTSAFVAYMNDNWAEFHERLDTSERVIVVENGIADVLTREVAA